MRDPGALTVREASADDMIRFFGPLGRGRETPLALVAERNGALIAASGIARNPDGSHWAWFDARSRVPASVVHRTVKRTLHARADLAPVYVWRDDSHRNSARWLRALGFLPEGIDGGWEVWSWRP